MTIVMVHAATGDEVRSYSDKTESEVRTLLQAEGVSFDFMTPLDYASRFGPKSVLFNSPSEDRNDAISLLLNDRHGESKFIRAVLLVLLDEINVIRAALSLVPRTVAQARTAIQNKINAGDAD